MRFPQTTGNQHTNHFLLHFPVVCKTGDIFIENDSAVLLREIQCRWCGAIFCVCQSCWRGQTYCCDACRGAAKRKAHREAQKRYRQTEKGKKAHREAENRRRVGLTKKIQPIVDDATANLQCSCSKIERSANWGEERQVECGATGSMRTGRCHFCGSPGVIVDQFPRRGYGKGNYSMKWHLFRQKDE